VNRLSKSFPRVHQAVGRILFANQSDKFGLDKYVPYFGWNVYAFSAVASKIKQDRFDILHAGFANRPATAAMILSDLTGLPFSFEGHAYDLFVDFPFASEKIVKASKIFTISDYNKQYLVEQVGCSPSKIVVFRVPFNRTYCDKISQKKRKDNLIISACRLHPIKGLEYAIDAFHRISQSVDDLRFWIIGDGPLRGQLCKKVQALSLNDKVTFLGNISNEQTLEHIAEATVFMLPSVIAANGDRDGIPTSLIEAMYMKTPVISSKVSGIPELIDDGVNGFLAEPKNVHELADKLGQLLLDPSLRIQMGQNARDKVEKEFNAADSSHRLVPAWQDILVRR
jgi:glycosyltransferase involved in cell wall biosynthesis